MFTIGGLKTPLSPLEKASICWKPLITLRSSFPLTPPPHESVGGGWIEKQQV